MGPVEILGRSKDAVSLPAADPGGAMASRSCRIGLGRVGSGGVSLKAWSGVFSRMAKQYQDKLSRLVSTLDVEKEVAGRMEVRHLFAGAALYVDGVVCASWSPVGLAFKLPEKDVTRLIGNGQAKPLKYFPKGHVKKGYALFESPEESRPGRWKAYFVKAVRHSAMTPADFLAT